MTTLDAYRTRRISAAQAERAAIIADAEAAAAAAVETARASADSILAAARRAGEADADREADLALASARREARRLVLEAQRVAFEAFSRRSAAAVLSLRERPDYAQLLDRLQARVVAELGEGARIFRDPPDAGGVVGEAGDRRVVASLTALADRCRRSLGAEVDTLWSPAPIPGRGRTRSRGTQPHGAARP